MLYFSAMPAPFIFHLFPTACASLRIYILWCVSYTRTLVVRCWWGPQWTCETHQTHRYGGRFHAFPPFNLQSYICICKMKYNIIEVLLYIYIYNPCGLAYSYFDMPYNSKNVIWIICDLHLWTMWVSFIKFLMKSRLRCTWTQFHKFSHIERLR